MDDRVVAVAVAVLVAWVGAALPAAAQSAAAPTITVDINAEPLDDGETHHTPTDPLVRVQVSADAPISLIEVRINGTTRRSFEPSSDAVDRSVFLDLETGPHRLTVVAEADGVATYTATILKDDAAPTVTYTAPFPPDASSDDPALPPATELTVDRGNVSIDGRLEDFSLIDTVRIKHTYDYELPDGTERQGQRSYLLPAPGADFRQSLRLVPGSNRIPVFAEDVVGNRRVHEFTIAVNDGTAPNLTVTDVKWVSPTRLHVEGRATDRVQVQSVWLASGNTSDGPLVTSEEEIPGRHPLVFPKSTAPDADRRSVRLDTTVYHPRGDDYVVLGTNDTAGNERTRNYSLSTFLAPTITVVDGRTGYVDDRTVAVGGRVVDGQVREVSVETVDPATGRIVDIRPVDLGSNGTFDTRLRGVAGETLLRVRVRDASGAEHLTNATVAAPLEPTAVPTGNDGGERESDGSAGAGVDPAAESGGNASDGGLRIPVVGVVVPTPDVGGVLSASFSLPIPFIGPIEIPLLAVGVLLAAVALVVRRRAG
ncbi:MAG: hypothetical protein ABEH58_01035 [Haloplanus sp.]